MLRVKGRRLTHAGEIKATVVTLIALLALLLVAAVPSGSAAGDRGRRFEARQGASSTTEYGTEEKVTILGVELDRRFGRAWLLAELSGEGHLRTVSNRLKAFAPPGEYEGGFVRIPLIPKLPVAKLLRRTGRAAVTVTIYFDPTHEGGSIVVSRRVTLVRERPAKPTHPVH